MKFLADEGIDAPIVREMRTAGYDVYYIAEEEAGVEDDYILKKANEEKRILITKDKDFGELVFRLKQIHAGVILARLEGIKPKTKAKFILKAILDHENILENAFTIIQPGIVRVRK